MTTNPDDKKPKQVLATYAVIALIVMFLLNIFVLPGIMERSIRETTYSDFLKGIDSKQIQEVQFDVRILSFITPSNRMAKLRSARPV